MPSVAEVYFSAGLVDGNAYSLGASLHLAPSAILRPQGRYLQRALGALAPVLVSRLRLEL